MNLALPEGVRPPPVKSKCKIDVQVLEQDVVGASLVSLGVRQTGENDFVAPLVLMGGLTKVEYVAAMIMGSGSGVCADKALGKAEELLMKAKERRERDH